MKKVVVTTSIVFLLLAVAYFFFRPRYLPPVHIIVSSLPGTYAKKLLSGGNAYLITDVSVIPMNQDTVLAHQNVFINHGRIVTITAISEPIDSSSAPVLIDGTGKFLIPGLSDMHVHINDDTNLLLFVANGVTTVRNMAGYPFHLQLREQIKQQTMLGPTLYTASPILEGDNKIWPFSIALKTKQDAANAVRKYKHEGYDFIKIYHTLPEDVYQEVLRVGDSVHIPVVGHIPFQVDLNAVLSLSQYSLEHIDVSPISPHIPLLKRLELIGQSGKWLCPTLVVYRNRQRNPIAPAQQTNYEQYVDGNTIKF